MSDNDPFSIAVHLAKNGDLDVAKSRILTIYLSAPAADRDRLFLCMVGEFLLCAAEMSGREKKNTETAQPPSSPKPFSAPTDLRAVAEFMSSDEFKERLRLFREKIDAAHRGTA